MKKTGIYFIGNIASKAMMAIIIPVYAFFVTPSAVGNYDYWLSLAQTVSPVVYLAIWEAILKFLISNDNDIFRGKVKGTVLIFVMGMSILSALVGVIAIVFIGLEIQMTASVLVMCVTFGMLQVWQYFTRSSGMTKEYAASGALASLVTFVLILILVCVLSLQECGLVIAYSAGQLFAILYLESRVRLFSFSSLRKASVNCLRKLLSYSTPCVFNLIAGTLTLTVGRMLIVNYLGADANGLYAFALKFANIVTALGGIFSMAVIEEGILRARTAGAADFYTHVSSALLLLLCSVACMGLPAIALFYDFIGGTDYSSSFALIPLALLYAVGAVISTQFGSVFMAMGKTANQAYTTIAGLIVSTVLSALAISPFGLVGAMLGLVAGTFFMALLRYVLAMKMIRFHLKVDGFAVLGVLYCLLIGVLFLSPFGMTLPCHLGCLLIACVISLPFFIRSIRDINNVPDFDKA